MNSLRQRRRRTFTAWTTFLLFMGDPSWAFSQTIIPQQQMREQAEEAGANAVPNPNGPTAVFKRDENGVLHDEKGQTLLEHIQNEPQQ